MDNSHCSTVRRDLHLGEKGDETPNCRGMGAQADSQSNPIFVGLANSGAAFEFESLQRTYVLTFSNVMMPLFF